MSLEHLVSHTLLEDPFYRVVGARWPADAPPIAAAKLGTKCLCRKHNADLSALDAEAGRFRDALIETRRVDAVRRAAPGRRRWSPFRKSLDGILFERWVLKTGFALVASARSSLAGWRPPAHFVEVALGHRPMPQGHELRVVAEVGDTMSLEQEFRLRLIADLADANGHPIGVEVNILGGWRFLLAWTRSFDACDGIVVSGDRLVDRRTGTMVRPRRLRIGEDPRSPISIDVRWPS